VADRAVPTKLASATTLERELEELGHGVYGYAPKVAKLDDVVLLCFESA
jgi:hypothetical protein